MIDSYEFKQWDTGVRVAVVPIWDPILPNEFVIGVPQILVRWNSHPVPITGTS